MVSRPPKILSINLLASSVALIPPQTLTIWLIFLHHTGWAYVPNGTNQPELPPCLAASQPEAADALKALWVRSEDRNSVTHICTDYWLMQIVCIFISPPTQGEITFFFLLRVHQYEKINKLVGLAADLPSHRLDLNSDTGWRNSFCVLNGIQLNLITITLTCIILRLSYNHEMWFYGYTSRNTLKHRRLLFRLLC